MATLTCTDWLDAWERSLACPPALRPCAVLAPLLEEGQDAAERLSVGRRDGYLLDLHQALFGPQVQALARCPCCGEALELAVELADLRQPTPALPDSGLELRTPGCLLRFRLPDSRDLAALGASGDIAQAQRCLLERCVRAVTEDGQPVGVGELSPELVAGVAQAMADADPQAVVELRLACPACEHGWSELFDVAQFLLHALDDWAERLLDQVHALAGAYGWPERDILGLSPARRARYLARVYA
jgi:hypothetical protein